MGTVLDLGTGVGPASRELGHPVITAGWERLFLSQEHFGIWDIFLLLGSVQAGRELSEHTAPRTAEQPGTSLHSAPPGPSAPPRKKLPHKLALELIQSACIHKCRGQTHTYIPVNIPGTPSSL